MTIQEFARKYRLMCRLDESNDPVIPGRIGMSNIYEYDPEMGLLPGVFGVMFITDSKKPARTLLWNKFKANCLAMGMTIRQCGDAEGSFTFDPNNPAQAETAIKGIRVRIRRNLSPEQLERLKVAGQATRFGKTTLMRR